ncbi:hypothetical protein FKP32DRAFT_1343398 [Trametes sanguinea]|nr:hypothetical protein FKP32DRAFT_1343398 [Trametes sanguinea]
MALLTLPTVSSIASWSCGPSERCRLGCISLPPPDCALFSKLRGSYYIPMPATCRGRIRKPNHAVRTDVLASFLAVGCIIPRSEITSNTPSNHRQGHCGTEGVDSASGL